MTRLSATIASLLGQRADGASASADIPIRQAGADYADGRSERWVRAAGFDQVLLWVVVGLLSFSLVMVYSASIALADNPRFGNLNTWHFVSRHAGSTLLGLLLAYQAFMMPMSFWEKHSKRLFLGALVLLALVLYGFIAGRPLPLSDGPKLNIKESLQTGLKFVFGNQIILSALALDMFAVLFGGAVALLPIFASDILKIGPQGLGALRSAPAIGSVTMAVFMAYRPITFNAGKKMLWAVAGFGACIIGFGLSQLFWLSFALLLMSGVLDSVSVIIRSTLIHTLTPEHMKGRVSSVNNIFVGSSNEIGSFESGLAAKLLGVVPSVVFGGSMTILIVAFTAWKADKLRKLSL